MTGALARRAPRIAIAVAVILLGSNLTTQLLKPALALPQPFPGIDTATWPSGHATAAMALALCLQLVVPARRRPLTAALGGLFVVGVAYSVLILGHHEPSDILGGFLVAGTWTGLVVAGCAPWRPSAIRRRGPPPRWSRSRSRRPRLTAMVGVFALSTGTERSTTRRRTPPSWPAPLRSRSVRWACLP